MITLLILILGVFAAYALYIAAQSARISGSPDDFLDGGGQLPAWGVIFGGAGVAIAGIGLRDHLYLASQYGLQYSHVALGLIPVALVAALLQKRTWIAGRVLGGPAPAGLLGRYFGSTTIRIYVLCISLMFAIPVSAVSLGQLATTLEQATGGTIGREAAIWIFGFFLFLTGALGGWRGVVYLVGALTFTTFGLLVFLGLTGGSANFLSAAASPEGGSQWDLIPGVLQYVAGIGKSAAGGGIWTTLAILSFAVAMLGIVVSPGFLFLGNTARVKRGFAFGQVWMTAGLAAGLLLLVIPFVAANLARAGSLEALLANFASIDSMLSVCMVLLLVASLQIAVAFFSSSGASIITLDLVVPHVLPDLTHAGKRLAGRIVLGLIYGAVVLLATFAPAFASISATPVLSLSVQLLPALLGLCWVPWISRQAVIVGLIFGVLLVVFTEPVGLIPFEGLFIDLPWGRWPLTIHSALWGLAANLAAVLIVSIFTKQGEERQQRERLHDEFRASWPTNFGGPRVRSAKWLLTLLWTFLAIGPGAILGNSFFSMPIFTSGPAALGVPSLWVWQLLFWFVGVLMVWWLAYYSRIAIIDETPLRTIEPVQAGGLRRRKAPTWIAQSIRRLADR